MNRDVEIDVTVRAMNGPRTYNWKQILNLKNETGKKEEHVFKHFHTFAQPKKMREFGLNEHMVIEFSIEHKLKSVGEKR